MNSKFRMASLDALRGIAILMVLFVHSSQNFPSLSNIRYFAYWCQMGVQLFFIASAFTLCLSMDKIHTKDEPLGFFFIRRFFRIAPGFYFGILLYAITRFILALLNHDISQFIDYYNIQKLFLNFSLLLGFTQTPDINRVVAGGWSIGTEVLFYYMLPFIYRFLINIKKRITKFYFFLPFAALLISFVIEYIFYAITGEYVQNNNYIYFGIINQFPIFMIGISLYFAYQDNLIQRIKPWQTVPFIILPILLSIYLMYRNFTFPFLYFFIPFISGIGLLFLCILLINIKNLKLPFLEKVGKISYSIYLVHGAFAIYFAPFIILPFKSINSDLGFLILYVIVVIVSYLLALLSYKYIEQTGINYGNQIIERLKTKKMNATASTEKSVN